MFDKLLKYGLGVSLVFGGAVGYGAADALFQKVLAVLMFFGASVFCAVMLVQAAAEDRSGRIGDDVRRVKIKEGSQKAPAKRTFWEEGAAAGKVKLPSLATERTKRRDVTQ